MHYPVIYFFNIR